MIIVVVAVAKKIVDVRQMIIIIVHGRHSSADEAGAEADEGGSIIA